MAMKMRSRRALVTPRFFFIMVQEIILLPQVDKQILFLDCPYVVSDIVIIC